MIGNKYFYGLVCLCLLLLLSSAVGAKSFKHQVSLTSSIVKIQDDYYSIDKKMPSVFLDYEYSFNKIFGIGAFLGYGLYDEMYVTREDLNPGYEINQVYKKMSASYHYGISGNIHYLSMFFKQHITRFDLYTKVKIGFVKMNSTIEPNIMPVNGDYLDASLALGIIVYLGDSFGLFAEFGPQYFKYNNAYQTKFGFSFRF